MSHIADVADIVELRLRVDASELRQAAVEARQVRIEKLLLEQSGEQRATNKLLNVLTDAVQKLSDRVAALGPKPAPTPPKRR